MSVQTIADRKVHPGTILLRFVKEVPSTVLALPAGVAVISDSGLWRALLLAGAIAVAAIFFNWLAWSRFRYGVGERDVVIESGILTRTRRSIPFDKIQDVDIERALLARLFGLAKVRIETGAGGKDEGKLDSVTIAEAERIRETVRAWRSGAAPSPLVQASGGGPPAPESLLFEMHLSRVLLFGLFNFSLFYIAGLFALLQTFHQLLPFDIYDPARWLGLAEAYLPGRFTAGAVAALLLIAALIGVVAGVLRTLARDYGFRLSLEGQRFRRERGLLTRTEVVIARSRIQLVQVKTGPIRRLFGWFGLSFQTLGAAADGSGHQAAAPFARTEELDLILDRAGRLYLPPPSELTMVSKRHILRMLAGRILVPLAAILLASLRIEGAIFLLALLPLLAAAAVVERRFHRYALAGELLFVTMGLWRQRLWIVPLRKVQGLSLSRSFLQRRLGLATLAVDTAGATMLNFPRIVDVRTDIARNLAAEIGARRRLHSSGRKSGTDK